jgi:hypothetical protein
MENREIFILKLKNRIEKKLDISDEAEVIFILSYLRKIIESDNLYNKYPHLYFFCCWALHSKIDRIYGISLLSEINDIIVENKNEMNQFFSKINNKINFPQFRDDFFNLLKSVNIKTEDFYWNSFLKKVILTINNIPVEFPEKNNKKIIKVYEKTAKTNISDYKPSHAVSMCISSNKNEIFLICTLIGKTRIVIPLSELYMF